MTPKKVLVLAPVFQPLHNQIIKGLETQNFEVTYVPDIVQRLCPYPVKTPFKNIKRLFYKYYNLNLKYHKKHEKILSQEWDLFLCINGCTLEREILIQLRHRNPNLKAYLYLWDSTRYFEFQRNFNLFDKVYTFDPLDAKTYNINYLPLFWVEDDAPCQPIHYDLSFIGKFHGDRYEFIKKIEHLCDIHNLSHFFKIVMTRKISNRDKIYRILGFSQDGKVNQRDSIITSTYLSSDQVSKIISESRCVLDSELKNQYGLTNRMIISLAKGKKVVSTNANILTDPIFYDEANIEIIDRDNPKINIEFLKSNYIYQPKFIKIFSQLEIKSWLKIIITGQNIDYETFSQQ